jgi:hypothetical protein
MSLVFSTLRGINQLAIGSEIQRAVSDGVNGFFVEFGELDEKDFPVFGEFILPIIASSAVTILVAHYNHYSPKRMNDAIACGADIISIADSCPVKDFVSDVSRLGALTCIYNAQQQTQDCSTDLMLYPSNVTQQSSAQIIAGLRESSPTVSVQLINKSQAYQFFVFDYYLHSDAVRQFILQHPNIDLPATSPLSKVYPDGLHINRDMDLRRAIFDSLGAVEPPKRLTKSK